MTDWFQTLILALIQGLSEFLPISSSAHLVLPSQLLGWQDQGLMFDVAVHVGTLVAVAAYFWRDLVTLLGDLYPPLRPRLGGQATELWRLGLASLPAVIAGLLLSDLIEAHLRGLPVIAATTLIFGVLLGVAALRGKAWVGEDVSNTLFSWRDALLMGFAQMLALIPGVSRSGVTITAGLLLGYSPASAARFSFLMSVPIILGAMLFLALDLVETGTTGTALTQMLVAAVIAGVSAYATIAFFLTMLSRIGLMPFVWYRMALAVVLIAVIVS